MDKKIFNNDAKYNIQRKIKPQFNTNTVVLSASIVHSVSTNIHLLINGTLPCAI